MPTKIRLQRHGRKKAPFYQIVVADSRSPRDGKFIEKIGSYNPLTVPATIELDVDRAIQWLDKGAQATETTHRILSYKGILFKRHLLRGVKKGVVKAEDVEPKFIEFMSLHDAKANAKKDAHRKHKAEMKKAAPKKEVVAEEAAPSAE
jgi:small subunit ribosomal protein S16